MFDWLKKKKTEETVDYAWVRALNDKLLELELEVHSLREWLDCAEAENQDLRKELNEKLGLDTQTWKRRRLEDFMPTEAPPNGG